MSATVLRATSPATRNPVLLAAAALAWYEEAKVGGSARALPRREAAALSGLAAFSWPASLLGRRLAECEREKEKEAVSVRSSPDGRLERILGMRCAQKRALVR